MFFNEVVCNFFEYTVMCVKLEIVSDFFRILTVNFKLTRKPNGVFCAENSITQMYFNQSKSILVFDIF